MEEKTYVITVECKNCGKRKTVHIEKGKTIKEFCSEYKCEDCGCRTTKPTSLW